MSLVSDIYNYFVRSSTATFQTELESLGERQEWFSHRSGSEPVTILLVSGEVLAWGALSLDLPRGGYRHTAETSVYVRHDCHRRGYGRALLADLIERARVLGYHTLLAGYCSEAKPSIALHESFGFREVGCFREVAGNTSARWM